MGLGPNTPTVTRKIMVIKPKKPKWKFLEAEARPGSYTKKTQFPVSGSRGATWKLWKKKDNSQYLVTEGQPGSYGKRWKSRKTPANFGNLV